MKALQITDMPTATALYSQEFFTENACEIAGKSFYQMVSKGTHSVKWLCVHK